MANAGTIGTDLDGPRRVESDVKFLDRRKLITEPEVDRLAQDAIEHHRLAELPDAIDWLV